jgi:hypothetical protein
MRKNPDLLDDRKERQHEIAGNTEYLASTVVLSGLAAAMLRAWA